MSGRPLVVLGTGGHASVVVDLARAAGIPVKGCVGPEKPAFDGEFCAYLGQDSVLDSFDRDKLDVTVGVGSVGDATLRRKLFEMVSRKGFHLPALTHPEAFVAKSAVVGEGSQVMAGAVVQSHARMGRNVIVNSGAIIEHHVIVEDHAHVAPGAVVCGGAMIGEGGHIGANATVLQGLQVGANCVVAAGSVVVRDVVAGLTVKGVPAA